MAAAAGMLLNASAWLPILAAATLTPAVKDEPAQALAAAVDQACGSVSVWSAQDSARYDLHARR
jgi:superoxide dismutase